MRFFKAFSILHRRAKSATFVTGSPPLVLHPPDVRASFSGSSGQKDRTPSLFDFITSRPPIPGNFNHIHGGPVTSGLWRLHRSGRTSATSIEPEIENEQLRLRDTINFWIHEHSILQDLLKDSEEKLLLERRKVLALQQLIEADRREKLELQARYETLLGQSHPAGDQAPSIPALSELRPPHLASSVLRQSPNEQSLQHRTVDEYTSALRMTLTTRRQLRDQKKATKFWKRQAMSEGKQSIVTPSVSTLSSLHDALPVERQTALDALVSRLGLTSKLAKIHANDSLPCPSMSRINVQSLSNEDLMSTLPSSLSRTSGTSRLGPLASESIKTEIGLMLGSKKLRQPSSPIRAPALASKKEYRASTSAQMIDIESFSDLNLVFERVFGSDINQEPNTSYATGNKQHSSAIPPRSSELPWSTSLLSTSFSSQAPISSVPSRSSQIFGNNMDELNSDFAIGSSFAYHGFKESRPSWQNYRAKSTVTNRRKTSFPRKAAKETESAGFSMSLPVFKTKQSRLPVPPFMKGDVS